MTILTVDINGKEVKGNFVKEIDGFVVIDIKDDSYLGVTGQIWVAPEKIIRREVQ